MKKSEREWENAEDGTKLPPLARVKVPNGNGWAAPSSGSNDRRHLRPLWEQ